MNKEKKYRVIGCNLCHRTSDEKGVTLRKAKDSYYCTSCYNAIILKELYDKKEEK